MTLKLTITKNDDDFDVVADSEHFTTTVRTTTLQKTIIGLIKDHGMVGKRGRKKGSLNKKGSDPVVDTVPF